MLPGGGCVCGTISTEDFPAQARLAETFARAIRVRRAEWALDQDQLGRYAGIPRNTISGYERCARTAVPYQDVLCIAGVFGMSVAEFLGVRTGTVSARKGEDDVHPGK